MIQNVQKTVDLPQSFDDSVATLEMTTHHEQHHLRDTPHDGTTKTRETKDKAKAKAKQYTQGMEAMCKRQRSMDLGG